MGTTLAIRLTVLYLYFFNCFAGRRYKIKNGAIQEMQFFADEKEYIKDFINQNSLRHDKNLLELPLDLIIIRNLLQEKSRMSDTSVSESLKDDIFYSSSQKLTALGDVSLFAIGNNGKIYERFNNGIRWVYMRHSGENEIAYSKMYNGGEWSYIPHPEPMIRRVMSITSVITAPGGSIYQGYRGVVITDGNGRMFQREPSNDGHLRWVDITIPQHDKIISSGLCGSSGSAFFASQKGELFERNFFENNWHSHGQKNARNRVAVVFDVDQIVPGSIFLLTRTKKLIQYIPSVRRWRIIGRPPGKIQLALQPGIVVGESLFLLSSVGLIQYQYMKQKNSRGKWLVHGQPTLKSPSNQLEIASSIGGILKIGQTVSMYMISINRHLIGYHWMESTWHWIDHGKPFLENKNIVVTLATVRPIVLHSQNMVVVMLEDGRLASYTYVVTKIKSSNSNIKQKIKGRWDIYDVPEKKNDSTDSKGEVNLAKYCSFEVNSEDNCIQGKKH